MNFDKSIEFWEQEPFTKYFPKIHGSWKNVRIGKTGESSSDGNLVLEHYRDVKVEKSDVSNEILDQLYGFHGFSTAEIKYPKTDFLNKEKTWMVGQVVNGYFGGIIGDLRPEYDDDFFDNLDEDSDR